MTVQGWGKAGADLARKGGQGGMAERAARSERRA